MKFSGSNLIKIPMIISAIYLGVSTLKDWLYLFKNGSDLNLLENYISFEAKNINDKRQNFIKQIQTTLEFWSVGHEIRKKLFNDLERKNTKDLEEIILSFHKEPGDIDSFSEITDRLLVKHADILRTKNKTIRAFYELRYEQELLKFLSVDTDLTSIVDFKYTIARNIVEDSVFIGNYAGWEGHKKFAFIINDLYFPLKEECEYTVPWNDTIKVLMLIMENRRTFIDTAVQNQIIVKTDDTWRSIKETQLKINKM